MSDRATKLILTTMAALKRGDFELALQLAEETARLPAARAAAFGARSLALAGLGRDEEAFAIGQTALALDPSSRTVRRSVIDAARRLRELPRALDLVDAGLVPGTDMGAWLTLRRTIVAELHLLGGWATQERLRVRFDPARLDALRSAAATEIATGAYALASEYIERALRLAPTDTDLRLLRARVQVALGADTAGAFEPLRAEVESINDAVRIAEALFELGEPRLALSRVEQLLAREPSHRRARLLAARWRAWEGDPERAATWLADLDARDPDVACVMGILALVRGNLPLALSHVERAAAADRDDDEAGVLRADLLRRLGRNTEALDRFRETRADRNASSIARAVVAVAIAGASDGGAEGLADVAHSLEGYPWAGDLAMRARTARRGTPDETALIAAAHRTLDAFSGNYSSKLTTLEARGAERSERSWKRVDPLEAARVASIRCFDRINYAAPTDVLRQFDALIARYPDSPLPLTHRGELHLWLGDYASCEADCRAALAISADLTRWARVGLAHALMRTGRAEEARTMMSELLADAGPLPTALAARAEASFLLGRNSDARADFVAALAANPLRISSTMQLALLSLGEGDDAPVRAIHAHVLAAVPLLFEDARESLGRRRASQDSDIGAMRSVLEASLAMMRGNRSSGRVTWIPADSRPRIVASRVFAQTSIVTGASR